MDNLPVDVANLSGFTLIKRSYWLPEFLRVDACWVKKTTTLVPAEAEEFFPWNVSDEIVHAAHMPVTAGQN
jgi:hypothetical protein